MNDSLAVSPLRTPAKDSQRFAQLALVHDDVNEVVRSLVAALGGAKVIGPRLFPQKSPDAAARYLLDCLNPNRDHDIGTEGFVTLLKWAREAGIHLGMHWLCDELHYARPQTIEPEDHAAEILRRVDFARDELKVLLTQLERLPRAPR